MGATRKIIVEGIPAPQGSKSAFIAGGRAVIVEGTSKAGRLKHKNWRDDVRNAARESEGESETFTGPVYIEIQFLMPSIKSDPYRCLHSTAPDLDKLIRSTLDSLVNAGVIKDDSLVYSINAQKRYATEDHERPGAIILIEDMTDEESHLRSQLKARAKRARIPM
jgi:Holliday junction resolvase RusA-like endonuclease